MSNIGKRVRIKNYFTDYNGRTGIITSLNSSGIVYCVDFDDGKKPLSCLPYIETHKYAQCKLIEEEFVLPAKWALKTNDDFKSWIRTWDKTNPSNKLNVAGTRWNEYYFNSDVKNTKTWKFLEYLPLGYTEISFEQFKQYVLKENKTEMKVGDKLSNYTFPQRLKAHINSKGAEFQPGASTGGWYDLNNFGRFTDRFVLAIENGYFQVSGFGYGWFKLDETIKLKKQTNMEKKIIGYKFKEGCEKFNQAAVQICQPTDIKDFNTFEEKGYNVNMTANSLCKKKLEDAKVLDLWFEAVYEELEEIKEGDFFVCIKEQPGLNGKLNTLYLCTDVGKTAYYYASGKSIGKEQCRKATAEEIKELSVVINGYRAVIKGGILEFGCQKISKEILQSLRDLQQRDAFKFKCSIDDVELTAETVNKLLKLYETS